MVIKLMQILIAKAAGFQPGVFLAQASRTNSHLLKRILVRSRTD